MASRWGYDLVRYLYYHLDLDSYTAGESGLVRAIRGRDGSISTSFLPDSTGRGLEPSAASYDLSWLTSPALSISGGGSHVVRVVDLFAGCGGLSLGVAEACRALGYEMWPVLANDIDARVLSVYGLNFPEAELVDDPIESLLDGSCGDALTENEKILKRRIGEIDLVIGGPPCQGHSDFNNHTRNNDPKQRHIAKFRMVFCILDIHDLQINIITISA